MTSDSFHPNLLQVGDPVGSWRIEKVLGSGGFGRIFKVERNGLPYTMKMAKEPICAPLSPEEEDPRMRMAREVAALLTSAPHPNLLQVHAVDVWPHPDRGYPFFVTDYIDADDWHAWCWRRNPTAGELVDTFVELVGAVRELHRRDVLHRELKAGNVLIRRSDGRPYLIDFGTVRLPGALSMTVGVPPGTLHLMTPESIVFVRDETWKNGEKFNGGVTADLYALGILLYEALTDAHPFDPRLGDKALLAAIITVPPTAPVLLNSRVPRSLSDIALRLLEKKPEDRYADTEALLHALEEAARQERESPAWKEPLLSSRPPAAEVQEAQAPEVKQETPVQEALPPQAALEEARGSGRRTWRAWWPLALLAGLALLLLFAPGSPGDRATLAASHSQPEGDPPMSTNSQDSHSTARGTSLRRLVVASLCSLTGLDCASVPVLPPNNVPCPEEAQHSMYKVLGLTDIGLLLQLDIHQPGDFFELGVYRPGPIVSRVLQDESTDPALPDGTLLFGHLWTSVRTNHWGKELFVVQYTEALLPGARARQPVCISLGTPFQGHWVQEEGSTPERAIIQSVVRATPVEKWRWR